jgi:preprotein translocase subunit SecG
LEVSTKKGFLAIICAVLLVLVVLAQNSKGGGLSSQFGGSGASNLIGVKKTGDVLEKLTWGFAIAIMVFSLATNFTSPSVAAQTDEILEKAKEQQAAPALDINQQTPPTDSIKK